MQNVVLSQDCKPTRHSFKLNNFQVVKICLHADICRQVFPVNALDLNLLSSSIKSFDHVFETYFYSKTELLNLILQRFNGYVDVSIYFFMQRFLSSTMLFINNLLLSLRLWFLFKVEDVFYENRGIHILMSNGFKVHLFQLKVSIRISFL